jgi:sigma-B regulation protein RsbU (phosphoserine phosphatase)
MRYNPEGILMHTALRSHPADQQGSCFVGVGNTLRGCDILVADVTGRDMGTAYRTLMLKTFFDKNCRAEKDPETFFRLVNRWLIENEGNDRMLTALFMRLDFAAMTGEIVSAGRPIVVRKCAGMPGPSLVETGGDVLGLHTEIHPASRTLHLRPGDRFFLGTESLIDTSPRYASTEKRKRLGKAGLLELVGRHAGLPLECATEGILNGLLRFCRFEPEDDMLLLGVEVP